MDPSLIVYENGDIELRCSLRPIRNRKMVSLEDQMRRLIVQADEYKKNLARLDELRLMAYPTTTNKITIH